MPPSPYPEGLERMKTLLVTGGNGYVGTVLVRRALSLGWRVFTLDNRPGEPVTTEDGCSATQIVGDIRSPSQWDSVLRQTDRVVHLAAVVGDAACSSDPDTAWETNYVGTVRLADACHKYGVRDLTFASTCSNYGTAADNADSLAHTWSPVNPQSLYATSKIFAEHHLLSARDRGLRVRILRYATLYGWSPSMRFDLVVNQMTANALREGVVRVFGGTQWRPFLHVRDAAEAALLSFSAASDRMVYNCGAVKENYRIMDVARMVREEVPDARLLRTPSGSDRRDYRVDFGDLAQQMGFRPQWTVAAGIREIAKELRACQDRTDEGGLTAVVS